MNPFQTLFDTNSNVSFCQTMGTHKPIDKTCGASVVFRRFTFRLSILLFLCLKMSKKQKKPCPRLIRASKYERTRAKNREWWQKLFDALEAEASIVSIQKRVFLIPQHAPKPSDRKVEVLAYIFPTNLLAKILSIITVEEDADVRDEIIKSLSKMTLSSRHHRFKMDSEESCSEESARTTGSKTKKGSDRNKFNSPAEFPF